MSQSDAKSLSFAWTVRPLGEALPEWRNARGQLSSSTTQDIAWVSTWSEKANADCIAVLAHFGETLHLVLSLEIVKHGPLTVARLCGGQHANENFPAMTETFGILAAHDATDALRLCVKTARPDVDVIELSRLIASLDGIANPFAGADSAQATDMALSLSIKDGFQAVLAVKNGSKKQKKIRQMARRMEERGPWNVRVVRDPDEIIKVLNCFYWLKAKRLAEKGIADVFGPEPVRAFFNAVFLKAAGEPEPEFELHLLEVDGAHVAISGCTVRGKRFNVEFGAISDTDANLSPGDFLYFHLIEDVCKRGFETFSFGTGDEPYKRSWCDTETAQYSVYLPLTLKGRIGAGLDRAKLAVKRAIKSNPKLFALAKRVRKAI